MALPAIIDYKVTEARCEKLPKLLPQLFSEVPEVNRRYANPNPNPNPNPNQVPEAEQLRRYAVLHQKYKQPLFDIFMQLGGTPPANAPAPVSQPEWYARRRLLLQERLEDRLLTLTLTITLTLTLTRLLLQERPEDRLEHGRRGAQGVHRSVPALSERHPSAPGG